MKNRIVIPLTIILLTLQSCVTNYVVAEPSLYTKTYKTDAKNIVYGKKFQEQKSELTNAFEESLVSVAKTKVLEELEKKAKVAEMVKKNSIIESLLDEAKTYLGTPYRYGGMSRRGIDCSAFVLSAYREALGVELPRVAASQATEGERVEKSELQKGDLIFFANHRRISHVGIVESVSEDGEIFFIHASSSQGVTITSLDKSSYWSKRFRYAKRIITEDKFDELLAVN